MVKLFIYFRNASTSFLHSKKCFRQNVVIRQRKPFGTAKCFKTLRKRLVEARSCQVSNLNMQGSYANDSNLQTVYAPFYKIYDNVRKKYNYEINKKCGEEIDSLWQVFCFVYSDELMAKTGTMRST